MNIRARVVSVLKQLHYNSPNNVERTICANSISWLSKMDFLEAALGYPSISRCPSDTIKLKGNSHQIFYFLR